MGIKYNKQRESNNHAPDKVLLRVSLLNSRVRMYVCDSYYWRQRRYYKIRQMIVLILRTSRPLTSLTLKRYFSRYTCLKFNWKTVLRSDDSAGTNSRRPALISTLTQKS